MQTATFLGLHCEACVKLISKRLSQLPGITSVNGDTSGVFSLQGSENYTSAQINQIMSGMEYTLKELK